MWEWMPRDPRATPGRAQEAPRAVARGRRTRAYREAARTRHPDRARAPRDPARPRLVRRDRHPRHPPQPRLRHGPAAHRRRRRGGGLGQHRRAPGLRVRPGLHGVRRHHERGQREEDLRHHGPGARQRRPGHRAQRLGRRPHPGGRALARRLRRRVPAQHPGLGRGAPDLGHPRALRRGGGLLPRHHRLHDHGRGHEPHVRDRPRGHQGRHLGGSLVRGPGRRHDPQFEERGGPFRGARRRRCAAPRAAAAVVPALEQRRGAADRGLPRSDRAPRSGPGDAGARVARQALRHEGRGAARGGRRRLLRGPRTLRAEHRGRLRAPERPPRGGGRQPAARARRRARHRLVGQGRALCALLRRLQHPARHLRGRARLPARHATGVGRHHPPRRQAALRLLRGHGAQAHRGDAQGLRRRLRRHVEQAHRRRLQRRLAERRDGRDGRGRRGQRPLSRGAGARQGPGRRA